MPRHPRLFLPEATYHVYCRVARGEFVFDDDFEAVEFIEALRKVRDLDGWTIFAWCLMGNHYHLVERSAVLQTFGFGIGDGSSADYLRWVRSVAEIRRAKTEVAELPWWSQARNVDEIADVDCHPEATTFDGKSLAGNRAELELSEFAYRFESFSGHTIVDLASRSRSKGLTHGRVEFATLAVSRFGFKCCDVAALLNKHGNSVTNWLNQGLHLAGNDPDFNRRLDQLDAAISRAT